MSALTEEQKKKAAAGQAQELRERKKVSYAARAGDVKALKEIVREDGGKKRER